MLIIHLTTGSKKGIIIKIINAQLNTDDDILYSAITRAFNDAMKTNLTPAEIKQKYYIKKYSHINFYDNGKYFNLEVPMSRFSFNNKTSDYIFIQESLLLTELNRIKDKRIVSLNFETASRKRASVCSIGYVVQENGEIIREEEILVNPKMEFSMRCIKIHGINPVDVENAPTWDKAWPLVQEYITDDTLVIGHNLRNMELSCIRQECERYGMKIPEFSKLQSTTVYDILKLSKKLHQDLDNHKLSTLADKYNIKLNHNTLSYAKACLQLFIIFQKTPEFNSIYLVSPKSKFNRQYSKILTPNTSTFDEYHIFSGKEIILTGSFSKISRKEANQIILNLGGNIGDRVTLNTSYLILSNTSFTELLEGRMDTKTKNACEYKNKGVNIHIISEDMFLQLVYRT